MRGDKNWDTIITKISERWKDIPEQQRGSAALILHAGGKLTGDKVECLVELLCSNTKLHKRELDNIVRVLSEVPDVDIEKIMREYNRVDEYRRGAIVTLVSRFPKPETSRWLTQLCETRRGKRPIPCDEIVVALGRHARYFLAGNQTELANETLRALQNCCRCPFDEMPGAALTQAVAELLLAEREDGYRAAKEILQMADWLLPDVLAVALAEAILEKPQITQSVLQLLEELLEENPQMGCVMAEVLSILINADVERGSHENGQDQRDD